MPHPRLNLRCTESAAISVVGDVAALDTGVSVWEINGASHDATNSFEHPSAVTLSQRDARTIELAPHSACTIAVTLR